MFQIVSPACKGTPRAYTSIWIGGATHVVNTLGTAKSHLKMQHGWRAKKSAHSFQKTKQMPRNLYCYSVAKLVSTCCFFGSKQFPKKRSPTSHRSKKRPPGAWKPKQPVLMDAWWFSTIFYGKISLVSQALPGSKNGIVNVRIVVMLGYIRNALKICSSKEP